MCTPSRSTWPSRSGRRGESGGRAGGVGGTVLIGFCPSRHCALRGPATLWPNLQNLVERGLGDPLEAGEAAGGGDVPQLGRAGLGPDRESAVLGQRVRSAQQGREAV